MLFRSRIGYDNVAGWLDGGMAAWEAAGGETAEVRQITPEELRCLLDEPVPPAVLDVRTGAEWGAGHLTAAVHIPLPELTSRLSELPQASIAVICGSGYRSSIAASLLQRAGLNGRLVGHIVGGMTAWAEMDNAPRDAQQPTGGRCATP